MTTRRVAVRFLNLFRRSRLEQQMRDEMEANLQIHIDENIARGMSREEARRQALIRLGGMEATKEAYRDQRGLPWFDNVVQDLRYGLRILVKAPGFAAVAVLLFFILVALAVSRRDKSRSHDPTQPPQPSFTYALEDLSFPGRLI